MAIYSYPQTDFSGIINLDILTTAVGNSSISVPLLDIVQSGGFVRFNFNGSLSTSEQTTLDTIVANHDGTLAKIYVNRTNADAINADIEMMPAGTGTVIVPAGYDANITTQSLVTKGYVDSNPPTLFLDDLSDVEYVGSPAPQDGDVLYFDGTTNKWQNERLFVPGQGKILQVLFGPIPAFSGTVRIPSDNTTPLVTEGVQIWSTSITPTDVANEIRITTSTAFAVSNASAEIVVAIFRDNTCVGVMTDAAANKDSLQTVTFTIYDTPNTTSPVTYQARVGRSGGGGNATWYINLSPDVANVFGGLLEQNAYTVEEIGI